MKRTLQAIIVTAFCTLAVFNLHMIGDADSLLSHEYFDLSEDHVNGQIEFHKTLPAFAKRPLSTFLFESVSKIFGIEQAVSFVLVSFSLLFFCGVLIYKLSEKIRENHIGSLLNIVSFYLTASVLFAFYVPVYTYDEPLQYCMILLSLIALVDNKLWLFSLFFTLAMITRETTAILLPGIIMFMIEFEWSRRWLGKIIIILLPITCYLFFANFYFNFHPEQLDAFIEIERNRFECLYLNLKNSKFAVESIISFFIIMALPLYFLALRYWKETKDSVELKFHRAFFVTFIINTLFIFSMAKTREYRLFALSLLFIWPVYSNLFRGQFRQMIRERELFKMFLKWPVVILFPLLGYLSYILAFQVFITSIGMPWENYHHEFFFILNLVLSILLLHQWYRRIYASEITSEN